MRFHFISHPILKDSLSETVQLDIRDAGRTERDGTQVTIRWKREPRADWADPFVELAGDPIKVIAQSRLLRSFYNFMEERKLTFFDPDAILVAIERDKGEQAVYVPSARKVVPIRTIDSEESKWKAMVGDAGIIIVSANEEDDAKREAGRRLMTLMDEDADLVDKVALWVKAGKPMKKVDRDDMPKIYPLDVYCKRGHQRAAAAHKDHKAGKDTLTIKKNQNKS